MKSIKRTRWARWATMLGATCSLISPISAAESSPQSLQERVNTLLQTPLEQPHRIQNVFGEKELDLKVHAILNNKALIHNTWYKKGDRIGVFTIISITNDRVVLVDRKSLRKELKLGRAIFTSPETPR